MTVEFVQHDHTDLRRWGGCIACYMGMPDQVDHQYPEKCSYYWVDTPIDSLLICYRHGFTSAAAEDESSTEPCFAIKCVGEFADYVHDQHAAVISHAHEKLMRDLAKIKQTEEALEVMSDYEEYMTYGEKIDCE